MSGRKTYWHLAGLGRVPRDYDIATSRLSWHAERGFAVQTPVAQWHARHERASGLRIVDWEAFRDPRGTTYQRYVEIQSAGERFLDELLRSTEQPDYDRRLAPEWIARLERVIAPLRYPVHGLQMAASYLGSLAAGGRVTIAFLLQSADEMRRIQRLAQRMAQLRRSHPGFGEDARNRWENAPEWQPMRKAIEQLLVTYDFGEAFVALSLTLKPAFDRLFMTELGSIAAENHDFLLTKTLYSLDTDCRWHEQFSAELARVALEQHPANADFVADCRKRWLPRVLPAMEAAGEALGVAPGAVAAILDRAGKPAPKATQR
jgi:toluene monooxygenase system protein E